MSKILPVVFQILATFALALQLSCQTAFIDDEVRLTYKLFGEPDFQKEKKVQEKMVQALEEGYKSNKNPKVLIDSLPEGLNYNDGVLSNKEGFNHKIISKFSFTKHVEIYSAWWTIDYENDFLDVYCNIQAPLRAVTLGLWLITPPHWACFPRLFYTREVALDHVKYLAELVGSDLVLTSFLTLETGDPEDLIDVISVSGFLLKIDPRLKGKNLQLKPQVFTPKETPKK
tara:strand:- start:161 stop:847 length:687 start_codon:yes stop_codon:yes gene_type:complete